jgi:hypothetical protein
MPLPYAALPKGHDQLAAYFGTGTLRVSVDQCTFGSLVLVKRARIDSPGNKLLRRGVSSTRRHGDAEPARSFQQRRRALSSTLEIPLRAELRPSVPPR